MLRPRALLLAFVLVLVVAAGAVPASAAAPKAYKNCKALNKDYPHGVGRQGARDKTSGARPVTTFKVSTAVYKLNTGRDRDKDGVACEKR